MEGPLRCPRCRNSNFVAEAVLAVSWDGDQEDIPVEDLHQYIRCDFATVTSDAHILCQTEDCEWSGKVSELEPYKE